MMSTETESIKSLCWYHPNIDRHVAETLLKHNGEDGAYLLRDKSNGAEGDYVLSVRSKDAVNHFELSYDGSQYAFGFGEFSSLEDLREHFSRNPLIAGENGVLVVLRFPYPYEVEEPDLYQKVRIHANIGTASIREPKALSVGTKEGYLTKQGKVVKVGTKEGYLTKQGKVVKNWKTRWFTLERYELKYYKKREDKAPIKTLDLQDCSECREDDSSDKSHCMKLVLSWRTFYFTCKTKEEMKEWISVINFKLEQLKKQKDQTLKTKTM